jgi:hypothetical protein
VVVHTGDNLGLGSVGQLDAVDDVELPQLHRHLTLPAPVVLPPTATRYCLDQAVANQDPMNRDP